MKPFYYFGLLGLALFEILNVYFIMPMPGSQEMKSLDIAYFLYAYRWLFRVVFGLMTIAGLKAAFSGKGKWIAALPLVLTLGIVYLFNFKMVADKMFLQAQNLTRGNRQYRSHQHEVRDVLLRKEPRR